MRRNVSAYGMPIVPASNTGVAYSYKYKLVEVSISISINGELLLALRLTAHKYFIRHI